MGQPAGGTRRASAGAHPALADRALRRALAKSVDRRALARNLLDSLGYVSPGPVTRGQATFDSTLRAPAYDPAAAQRLLDSLGWRRPAGRAGGLRHRAGVPLRFAVLVPASSTARVRAAVMLQHMFAAVGVGVDVDVRDHGAVIAALRSGAFDAALTAFRVEPDPSVVQAAWGGEAGRTGRGFNFGGFDDGEADRLMRLAERAPDAAAARAAYRSAYQRILDGVPAVFLYEPAANVVHSRRLCPSGVRADAWWADLAAWRIDLGVSCTVRAARAKP
jgi:peptide/nickel transport system substrate-binding protein